MKINWVNFIFVLLMIFQACAPNQKELNAARRAEVIAVHDEVMPKMGQLKSLEKKALQRAEELTSADSLHSAQAEEFRNLALELDQAYEAMFVWMRQYDAEDGDLRPEEVQVYLEEQMVSVTEVNRLMKEAIAKADSLLKDQ